MAFLKKTGFFLIILLNVSACASIFNRKEVRIQIKAEEPLDVTYQSRTIKTDHRHKVTLTVPRQKESILLILDNGKFSKELELKSKLSPSFFLNIPYNMGFGMLIDLKSPKRFTYPRVLDIQNLDPKYNVELSKLHIAKFSLANLSDIPSPTLHFDYEYVFQKKKSFITGAGIVLPFGHDTRGKFQGYRLKMGYRYYFNKEWHQNEKKYIQIEYTFRHSFLDDEDAFERFGGLYIQSLPYTIKSLDNGLTIGAGLAWQAGANNQFHIETGLGLGIRYIHNQNNLPNDVTDTQLSDEMRFFFFQHPYRQPFHQDLFPSIILNLKIGYIFKKKNTKK